ncbi:MAG: hypothetical protein QW838_02975 [Candidatus Nitrosotenuis sp.]
MEGLYKDEDVVEVIVMPEIKSKFNLCLGRYEAALGRGHNGATAGNARKRVRYITDRASVVEALVDQYNDVWFVQDREATQVQAGGGNICLFHRLRPHEYTIVFPPPFQTSFSEFEKIEKFVASLGDNALLVVDSFVSHVALQAIAKRKNLITKDALKKFKEIKEIKEIKAQEDFAVEDFAVSEGLRNAFLNAFRKALRRPIPIKVASSALIAALGITRLFLTTNPNTRTEARTFGFSAGLLTKFLCAFCLGEARHQSQNNKKSRDEVYCIFLGAKLTQEKISSLFMQLEECFNSTRGCTWKGGYGGPSWGAIAACGARIAQAGGLDKEALNRALNAVHNNGPVWSKLIKKSMIDFVAGWPQLAIPFFVQILLVKATSSFNFVPFHHLRKKHPIHTLSQTSTSTSTNLVESETKEESEEKNDDEKRN